VPGEKEYAGKGVSYCAVCDGAFFKGEVLAVVGVEMPQSEEADYLTRYATKVYIVHRRDRLRASKILQEPRSRTPKIEMIWNKQVVEITGTSAVSITSSSRHGRESVPTSCSGVFISSGFKPNTGLVEGHSNTTRALYFLTDDRMMTSIPGLFVAATCAAADTSRSQPPSADATTAAIASRSISRR